MASELIDPPPPVDLREFEFALAQLRHAYMLLKTTPIWYQAEFAEGLLAPQIERFERLHTLLAAAPQRQEPPNGQ